MLYEMRGLIKREKTKLTDPKIMSMANWGSLLGKSNKDTAISTHSAVYGVVNRKSNAIAILPLKLYKKSDNKRTQINNDLSTLVSISPQANRTAFLYWRTIEAMKEIYGNAYSYIDRDINGKIKQLVLLDPLKVEPYECEADNYELYYKVYTNKGVISVHHMDMLHFPSIYGKGYKGISFIDSLSVQLELTKTTVATAKSQADNSLKVSGTIKLASNLNDEAIELYQQQFREMYAGGWNTVLVLDAGADYTPLKFDVQDLKLLETHKVTAQQVAMASNIPPFMLGVMDGAKYNNIEHQNIDFVQSCMLPDCVLIEQELNKKLLTSKQILDGMYFKFNLNALLRADMGTRADYYAKMIPIAGLTVNEIRALEDFEGIGEIGDRPLTTLNLTFLDTLDQHERLKGGDKSGDKSKQE